MQVNFLVIEGRGIQLELDCVDGGAMDCRYGIASDFLGAVYCDDHREELAGQLIATQEILRARSTLPPYL